MTCINSTSEILKIENDEDEDIDDMDEIDITELLFGGESSNNDTHGETNPGFNDEELANMSFQEIRAVCPAKEKELRDIAFEKAKNDNGVYRCANCHHCSMYRFDFDVTHIVPLQAGGKTEPENLQILCKKCKALREGYTNWNL